MLRELLRWTELGGAKFSRFWDELVREGLLRKLAAKGVRVKCSCKRVQLTRTRQWSLAVLNTLDILGSHGFLQPLDCALQFFLTRLCALLLLHGLNSLGFVDSLKFPVLADDFFLLVLEGLDLLLFLVGTLLEFRLLRVGLVQTRIQHIDLLLALLRLRLGLLEALLQILQVGCLCFGGGAVLFAGAIDLR